MVNVDFEYESIYVSKAVAYYIVFECESISQDDTSLVRDRILGIQASLSERRGQKASIKCPNEFTLVASQGMCELTYEVGEVYELKFLLLV